MSEEEIVETMARTFDPEAFKEEYRGLPYEAGAMIAENARAAKQPPLYLPSAPQGWR